jgi:uncharacterized protein
MPTFVLRLIAPRPNFAQSLTDAEREIMNRHAAYWRPYLERGDMVVFGPILTDDDSYGLAVVQTDDEQALREFAAQDPVVTTGTAPRRPDGSSRCRPVQVRVSSRTRGSRRGGIMPGRAGRAHRRDHLPEQLTTQLPLRGPRPRCRIRPRPGLPCRLSAGHAPARSLRGVLRPHRARPARREPGPSGLPWQRPAVCRVPPRSTRRRWHGSRPRESPRSRERPGRCRPCNAAAPARTGTPAG